MAKKVTDLPEATQVDDADLFMMTQVSDGLSKKVTADKLGSGGSGGSLQFSLDNTSLSQLVSAGSTDFKIGGGGTAQRWTVSAAGMPERGSTLLYTPDGGNTVTEIFMFSQALTFPTERRDMIIEMEIGQITHPANSYFGVFFMADADTPLHGLSHVNSNAGDWSSILNNGTEVRSPSTSAGGSKFNRYTIRARKPVSGPPEVSSYMQSWGDSSANTSTRRTGSSSTARGGAVDFGSGTSLGSTWDSPMLNRFGITVMSAGGAAPPSSINLLDYRVYVL